MVPCIYITTPAFNAAETIDATIQSVINQAGDFVIRYHVQDGGSTDATVERLRYWQTLLAAEVYPMACWAIEFSFDSSPDAGMYDAICKGFERTAPQREAFMTWINADDILMPGALATVASLQRQFSNEHLSWLGGAAHVIRDNVAIANADRPMPRHILREGLCDGTHWDFLQQEGTFFRNWLWRAAEPDKTFRPFRLAGDWNLWRLFAARASLVQLRTPLGGFRVSPMQLSARQRAAYVDEMNGVVPEATRRARFLEMEKTRTPSPRRYVKFAYKDGAATVVEEVRNNHFAFMYQKALDQKSAMMGKVQPDRILSQGVAAPRPVKPVMDEVVRTDGSLWAFDRDWQFPAITEQHAYLKLRETGFDVPGVTYVAFPWATLIDKIQTKSADVVFYMHQFRDYLARLPEGTRRITVCQHILMKRFLHLFEEAGITDVFWAHATKDDLAAQSDPAHAGLRLHAFPLYPVQVLKAPADDAAAERPHLFSFIGARANQYYLTKSRNWILEALEGHSAGLVIGRDSWHYNKVVYDHQIRGKAQDTQQTALVDQDASAQFRASLLASVFALCPSGSGPNSIRLWEAMGAGAIPVILADTYAPPGNPALWEAAVVFCDETPEAIAALPERLAGIAADPVRLAAMRHALRQLWMLYGPDSFVYDVLCFGLAESADGAPAEAPATPEVDAMPAEPAWPEGPLGQFGRRMAAKPAEPGAAALFLRMLSGALLTNPAQIGDHLGAAQPLGQLMARARGVLAEDDAAVGHLDRVLAFARRTGTVLSEDAATAAATSADVPGEAPGKAPARLTHRGHAPRIAFVGRHSHRTPLSYAPLARLLDDRARIVTDPAAADVIMTGFSIDLRENTDTLLAARRGNPEGRVMVVSEEPLWDVIWSGDFTVRNRVQSTPEGDLPWRFVNHHNSSVFDFDRIPYFLLTSDDFPTRYGLWMARMARISIEGLLAQWAAAPVSAAFYAEQRDTEAYAKSFPERDVISLSTWRTDVARACQGPGVVRQGKGWNEAGPRQKLPDWHLDKLAALAGRVRVQAGFENTHEAAYISEKIFDAFVTGGIPAYYASPRHRVFDLVPAGAMLNCWGLSPQEAAAEITDLRPDAAMAEAWIETAHELQSRFADPAAIRAERMRVVEAVLAEVTAVLEETGEAGAVRTAG